MVKNLLENAIRHTSEGPVIRVHVDNTGFSVEDSGIGIPKSMREKIFERFWRAKRSDTSGSGLGLAITREILACYCAHIAVEESPQLGGAMFRVSFSTLP